MESRKDAVQDGFVASTIAEMGRFKTLRRVQVVLLVLCYGALACAIAAKFLGGSGASVISLSLFGAVCGLASLIPGRRSERILATANVIMRVAHESALREPTGGITGTSGSKISLVIGFANLSGDDMRAFVSEDAAALGGLFVRCAMSAGREIPRADVLFVYAHLDEDGSLQGESGVGIRERVEAAKAAIVVLASPNPEGRVQRAAAMPGPKFANIVFTLDRNGTGFGQFFRDLFGRMARGEEMLGAWVALAPQGPGGGQALAPRTMLVAEAGRVAFPL